jgi:hypothetical protein
MMQPAQGSRFGQAARAAPPASSRGADPANATLAVAIIAACALQNFVLAIVSANVAPVNEQAVTVIQLALTLAALGIGVLRTAGLGRGFYWAIYAFVCLYGIGVWRHGDADLRFLYDVSVVPIFILLGSSLPRFPLKAAMALLAVVAAVTIFELLFPDLYVQVVNPLGYFLDTREWVRGQFENIDADEVGFYLGSQRPGGITFLNFLSDTRLGSIFMEPLSLGYFSVVASLVVNYFFSARRVARYGLLALCALLAALADSRISVFCVVAISLMWPVARVVPRQLALLPPLIALAVFIVIAATSGGAVGPEELAGRLAITIDALQGATAADILFGGFEAERSSDSAIVAIVANAGLFAVPILLALYSGLFSVRRSDNALHWGAFLYILLASLFGGALFSIKTAPLLGALVGYAAAHPRAEPDRS